MVDIFWGFEMERKKWDGSGLPPTETVCEYYCIKGDEWRKCRIVAYYLAKVVAVDAIDCSAVCLRVGLFRPIKTPDQIAAEERQDAIAEMVSLMQGGASTYTYKDVMGALYDAGYRKTEVKK